MNKLVLFAASIVLTVGIANAKDYKAGAIEIDSPWSRATPKGATIAAGYMTIKNTGTTPERLVSASSPIAGNITVHEMTMDKGVMKMRPVTGGLEIEPGATVELKPSSLHLMITNVKQPIEKGKPFAATLTFERAGAIDIEFSVEAAGAMSPATEGMSNMHNMSH